MLSTGIPIRWDYETDVLIIGGGTTGLPAGIKVAEAGLKATILETRPQCGGSLAMIAGGCNFAGTDEQIAEGVNDSPDILYQDMLNVGADPKLARAYADNQLEAYNMLKAQGLETYVAGYRVPGHGSNRGGIGPATGRGPAIVKAFEDRARARGVEFLFRHRAQRLITDPQTGKVIGAQVDIKGETKYFKAKRAVIIATGGFGYNKKMITEYAPHMVNCVPKMPISHMGDGLKMGLAIGAATKDIGISVAGSWPIDAETHSRAIWALDWGGILVNVNGDRFYNESSKEGFYGRMTEAGMLQPGGVYWVILDEKIRKSIGILPGIKGIRMSQVKDIEECKKVKADTAEELAKLAGINPVRFKKALEKYNSDVEKLGYDTVFNRTGKWGNLGEHLEKLTPPFYAIKCITSLTSMKGGLKINEFCQVVNNFDEVIPGLYAGGEVTGGLWTKSYLLGLMTSFSMAHGIIAGVNAAKEPVYK